MPPARLLSIASLATSLLLLGSATTTLTFTTTTFARSDSFRNAGIAFSLPTNPQIRLFLSLLPKNYLEFPSQICAAAAAVAIAAASVSLIMHLSRLMARSIWLADSKSTLNGNGNGGSSSSGSSEASYPPISAPSQTFGSGPLLQQPAVLVLLGTAGLAALSCAVSGAALVVSMVKYYRDSSRRQWGYFDVGSSNGTYTIEGWTCVVSREMTVFGGVGGSGRDGAFAKVCAEAEATRWLTIPLFIFSLVLAALPLLQARQTSSQRREAAAARKWAQTGRLSRVYFSQYLSSR